MNKILLTSVLLFLLMNAIAQNVGINNTDPKSALDLNGGFRLRSENTAVTGTNVILTSNRSHHVLIGSPVVDFNIAFTGATENGQHAIITNTTLRKGFLVPIYIQPNTTVELIYSNGAWKLIGTTEPTSSTAWGLTGNAGTDTSVNFIGTTDDKPLRVKINNENAGLIDRNNGNTGLGYLSLNPKGISNTAFGANSLSTNKSGYNVAIGSSAMPGDVNGDNNVAIGASSLLSSKNSNGTVAIGYQAANSDTAANGIIAIGRAALNKAINAHDMVAIGDSALYNYTNNSGVTHNVAIGTKALFATNGLFNFQNTAVGSYAMAKNNVLNNNTAIGTYSLYSNMGAGNTAVGSLSLLNNLGGLGNIAVGTESLLNNENGFYNVAVGYAALHSNIDGRNNIALGNDALYYSLNSSGSIAIGDKALRFDSAANGTIAIGRAALYNTNGKAGNLAIGDSALYNNGVGPTNVIQSVFNTAVGSKSLLNNTSGYHNTALGYYSLYANEGGQNNTAVGKKALYSNTSGVSNTAVGSDALLSCVSGFGNTAVGASALLNNNNFIGGNTAIGNSTLVFNNGQGNIAVGNGAMGSAGGTGSLNVAIGLQALKNNIGSANIAIGYQAGADETGSNNLYIENSNANKDNALIYGDFAADSLLLNAKTVVRNNAVVRGYTKLGGYDADVPSIKMKKISIPAGPAVNAVQSYPLGSGITDAKVVGIQVLMNYAGSWKIPPSYIDAAGYEYNVQVQNNNIVVVLKSGNSANIGGKPISVIVTYEE